MPIPPSPQPGLLQSVVQDIRFARALRYPHRRPTWRSSAAVLLRESGLYVVMVSRVASWCAAWKPAGLPGRAARRAIRGALTLAHQTCCMAAKSEISTSGGVLEGGIYLSCRGHVILGARAIGAGTVIHDHVTIGRGTRPDDKPALGRGVWIGPHSVIYGRITLGDGVTVLPHSAVGMSLPAGVVVQGNPARIVRRSFDNQRLRSTLSVDLGGELDRTSGG